MEIILNIKSAKMRNAKMDNVMIHNRMLKVADKLNKIRHYQDIDGFVRDLEYHVDQLDYFYNELTDKNTGDPSTTFYLPKKLPTEHQIAYFNLTRGFPKELYGGHWCYVYKQLNTKVIVIPMTSVKEDSAEVNSRFELDIKIKDFKNKNIARLQISDMRTIDIQRLYIKKGFYDVETEREIIQKNIKQVLY